MPRRSKQWLHHFGTDEPRRREDPLLRKATLNRILTTDKRQWFRDDKIPGFALMITKQGKQSFTFDYRRPNGKTKRLTFKRGRGVDVNRDIKEARQWAAGIALKVTAGTDPTPALPASYDDKTLRRVVHDYLAFRGAWKSRVEFERTLNNHVLPVLGERVYESITRRDLAALRDGIVSKAGKHAAHNALKCLSVIWNQYYRDHATTMPAWPDVTSPLKGVDRNGNGRLLSDLEIKSIWQATFKLPANKGAYFRFLFLTAMRRSAAARIERAHIVGDVLHIPGSRTKPAYELPLSAAAAELLRDHFGSRWGFEPLGPFGPLKSSLDGHLAQVAPWTIHHIRHSARSLLSKVTTPDIAELCLGHALKGMRRVYDHHLYQPEKRAAMKALALLIADITK
jgi:integrase